MNSKLLKDPLYFRKIHGKNSQQPIVNYIADTLEMACQWQEWNNPWHKTKIDNDTENASTLMWLLADT